MSSKDRITGGCLCGASEADRVPGLHCFSDQKVPWLELGDDLPHYRTDNPDLAKYKEVGTSRE